MKTRFYRRVGTKNFKLNISKSGVSNSIKLGRFTINPQRNRVTFNTPIKGLSLYGNLYDNKAENELARDCKKMFREAINVFNEIDTKLSKAGYKDIAEASRKISVELRKGDNADLVQVDYLIGELLDKLEEPSFTENVNFDPKAINYLYDFRDILSKLSGNDRMARIKEGDQTLRLMILLGVLFLMWWVCINF